MFKQLAVCAALVGATTSVAEAGNGTNLTKYVADTTQLVFVLDVSAGKRAKLVKDSLDKLLDAKPDARAKLAEIGLDPLRDIDTVMLTLGAFDELTNLGDKMSMVMVIEGRMPKDALAKIKAKADATATQDGVEYYRRDDTELAMIDGRVFFAKQGHMGDVIAIAKGKAKSLATGDKGKAMRDTIKHASTKSHVWGAVVLPAKDRDKTVAAQLPIEAASFGIKFASDMDAKIRLETPSATSAEASVKTLGTALPQVKMMMGSIGLDVAAGTLVVAQDKSAITASIKVSQTELKTLFALAMSKGSSGAQPAPTPTPSQSGGLGSKKSKTP